MAGRKIGMTHFAHALVSTVIKITYFYIAVTLQTVFTSDNGVNTAAQNVVWS
jgi:hypothetical protein